MFNNNKCNYCLKETNNTLICNICNNFLNKMKLFQQRYERIQQFHDQNKESWDECLKRDDKFIENIKITHLNYSNTLCLDITPDIEIEDNFVTEITSYCQKENILQKYHSMRNYCEGMKNMQREKSDSKIKKKNRKSDKKIEGKLKKLVKLEMCNENNKSDDDFVENDLINHDDDVVYNSTIEINNKKTTRSDFDSMFVCRFNLTKEEQLDEMEKRKTSQEYMASSFKCNKCFIGFKFQYSLDNHLTKKHSENSGSIVCEICTQRFTTQNKYGEHTKSHHKQILQCILCGKRLKERKRLKDHWESHLGVTHTCDICKKGFKTKSSLIHHISIHSNKFPCPHCSITLRSTQTFKKHLLLHSAVRPHACQSCPRTFPSRELLELHIQRAHAPFTDQFYCVECDYRFKSNREYKKHLTSKKHTHPSLLIHSCQRCPRKYATQEDLSRHTSALHDRVLTYTCPECPARFATTRGLYGHKRTVHLGYVAPKKYSCSYCSKAFRDKYYLTNHIRIHTGDLTHKCSLCLVTFTHKSALTHHIKQTHKNAT